MSEGTTKASIFLFIFIFIFCTAQLVEGTSAITERENTKTTGLVIFLYKVSKPSDLISKTVERCINHFTVRNAVMVDWNDWQNYGNKTQVVIIPKDSWNTWTGNCKTKTLCDVASCWLASIAEVAHTNLEHAKSRNTASVKCKTLPPFRGVRVSLLFCLATKQNLKWPTFIPTPIPLPLASSSSSHTHTAANTRRLNEDWKCEVEHPITRHGTPCWYQLPLQVQTEVFSETVLNPEATQV